MQTPDADLTKLSLPDFKNPPAEFRGIKWTGYGFTNRDKEICDIVYEVFGISEENPMTADITIIADEFTSYFKNNNTTGGHAYFLPKPILRVVTNVL